MKDKQRCEPHSELNCVLNVFGKFLWQSRKSVNLGALFKNWPLVCFFPHRSWYHGSTFIIPDSQTHNSQFSSWASQNIACESVLNVQQPLFHVSFPVSSCSSRLSHSGVTNRNENTIVPSVWDGGVGELVITDSRARETRRRRPSVNSHFEFEFPVIMWLYREKKCLLISG